MRDQEIIGLWEAYRQVYSQPQEEVEQLDEAGLPYGPVGKGFRKIPAGRQREAMMKREKTLTKRAMDYAGREGEAAGDDRVKMGKVNAALMNPRLREETDLFDIILEHLVAEGYAETNEAALAIMANMSEEWKQSIVEGTAAIRANVPQPGQRTVSMTATGKEPAGDRLIRQAGQAISSFLGSRGVVKSEPALQRKPLVSRTVK